LADVKNSWLLSGGVILDWSRSSKTKELDRWVAIHYHGVPEDFTVSITSFQDYSPFDHAIISMLMSSDWDAYWDWPLTADELLGMGQEFFEPLFHEPPVGPIPDYLAPHLSVHGCVAEYEDKIEQLDRWKALELDRWLKARIGKKWGVAGKACQLLAEEESGDASQKYRFVLTDEQVPYRKLTTAVT